MANQTLTTLNFPALISARDNQVVTSSLDVAKAFGKLHKNILAKIDEICAQVPDSFKKLNFKPLEIEQSANLGNGTFTTRAFELTKDGFMLLVMGFTGKLAMAIKVAYIEAFNAMLAQLSGSLTQSLTLTPAQQQQVKEAVNQLSRRTGETHQSIYRRLYRHFQVPRYQDIPASAFQAALAFLEGRTPDALRLPEHTVTLGARDIEHLAYLLLHAYMMRERLRYMHPALERLDVIGHAEIWSLIHDTYSTFIGARKIIDAALPQIMQTDDEDRRMARMAQHLKQFR